jgi:hypothetical protein
MGLIRSKEPLMARTRSRETPAMSTSSWQCWRPAVVLVVGLAGFLFAVFAIARFTRSQVLPWDRYSIPFDEIESSLPPVQERTEFLAEVRALGDFPQRLPILDENLLPRLAEAFARHPTVESVQDIELTPSRHLKVVLAFRIPVLEVMLPAESDLDRLAPARVPRVGPSSHDRTWVLDANGTLLPRQALKETLPLYFALAPPRGTLGQRWGDRTVERAARTAAYLAPFQDRLRLVVLESRSDGLVWYTLAGTRVVWGQPPDAEAPGEAQASVKLDRLLDACAQHGNLDQPGEHWEIDLRPAREAIRRALPTAQGR